MNDLVLYPTIIFLATLIYLPARWAKSSFSGKEFTLTKFWTAAAYNTLAGYIHMQFALNSTLPFYGHADNSIIDLFSFIMAVLHAFALPMPFRRNSWLKRKKPIQTLDIHSSITSNKRNKHL